MRGGVEERAGKIGVRGGLEERAGGRGPKGGHQKGMSEGRRYEGRYRRKRRLQKSQGRATERYSPILCVHLIKRQ